MTDRSKERRKHPRSRRRFSLPEDGDGLINHVENISVSGVLCQTKRPVPEMTKMGIELELPHPSRERVKAEGVVVRCDAADRHGDEFTVAILFTSIDDVFLEAIRRYVEEDIDGAETA